MPLRECRLRGVRGADGRHRLSLLALPALDRPSHRSDRSAGRLGPLRRRCGPQMVRVRRRRGLCVLRPVRCQRGLASLGSSGSHQPVRRIAGSTDPADHLDRDLRLDRVGLSPARPDHRDLAPRTRLTARPVGGTGISFVSAAVAYGASQVQFFDDGVSGRLVGGVVVVFEEL